MTYEELLDVSEEGGEMEEAGGGGGGSRSGDIAEDGIDADLACAVQQVLCEQLTGGSRPGAHVEKPATASVPPPPPPLMRQQRQAPRGVAVLAPPSLSEVKGVNFDEI